MKVLIVCSGNAPGFDFEKHQAFIYDQVMAVGKTSADIQFDYFFVRRKGMSGYLRCRRELIQCLRKEEYGCIHAHFSLSSLLANLQRKVPVVATFHGSDINNKKLRLLSAVVETMSKKTIYVSDSLRKKALLTFPNKSCVLPCGVDFDVFRLQNREATRKLLGFLPGRKYILFSSGFDNPVKNYPLAHAAVGLLKEMGVEIIELKDHDRHTVAQLMSAVDVALMTSYSEGSPQFIKEALACNCPVVSTDVGDARHWIAQVRGCYLTSYEPADVADKLSKVLESSSPIKGREAIQSLDNDLIAKKLISIYHSTVQNFKSES
ncbi:glycosyltransferase family 4 protein [Dyadobacter alkalitolerans]|uniref:glycosyltransferase family 4 protein n=1 Tax=Dyadobacter alkalitolerans TaxID=492736 RepID=UPI00040E225C|nr:glycosyltransferase family 4 protein [Dyadobacter alkalitolerans]